jgi:hypothetical protein
VENPEPLFWGRVGETREARGCQAGKREKPARHRYDEKERPRVSNMAAGDSGSPAWVGAACHTPAGMQTIKTPSLRDCGHQDSGLPAR